MAYTKTNWINDETPINADNLNKIENQLAENTDDIATNAGNIQENTNDISSLQTSVSGLTSTVNSQGSNIASNTQKIGSFYNLDNNFYEGVVDVISALNKVPYKLNSSRTTSSIEDQRGVFNLFGFIIEWQIETNIDVPATSYTTTDITFMSTFTKKPAVFAQPLGNYNIICQLAGITKTGFTLNARSGDGIARTDRSYLWVAIGV